MFENLFSPEWWAAQKNILAGLIQPVILRAYHAGLINGNDLLQALFDVVVDLDISNDLIAAAAKQYSFTIAGQIHETTQNYLQETVSSWIASGEPLADLEKSLVQSGYFSADRANRIAVTSITEVFADANIAAWQQSGVVSAKRWNTAQDDLVCPICEPLAGMAVALDANGFTTEGDFGLWAPPAHVRCVLPDNLVLAPGEIVAAAKSFYNGPCVEITTASGRKLSITENHPVLTSIGWVPAGMLNERSYVVSAPFGEGELDLIDPHNNNVPTLIQDIWNSLEVSDSMSAISVPSTPVDFHGDGRFVDGEIDVVYANSLLGANRDMLEHIPERSFGWRDMLSPVAFDGGGGAPLFGDGDLASPSRIMGGGDLIGSLFCAHGLPLNSLGLGLGSQGDTLFREPISNGGAPYADHPGYGIDRRPVLVETDNALNVGKSPALMAGSVFEYATVFESPGDCLRANTPHDSEISDSFSAGVSFDKVINVRKFDFAGHVYDLQVDRLEFYMVDSIITHNCRCWLQPVVEETAE